MKRIAVLAAAITVVLGVATGLYLLFGPTYYGCSVTATAGPPGVASTPGPQTCGTASMVQIQAVWPLPLLAIVVWSLAPVLALAGVLRSPPALALVYAAVALEATVLISFGAAPFFAPFVLLPLVITALLARRAA